MLPRLLVKKVKGKNKTSGTSQWWTLQDFLPQNGAGLRLEDLGYSVDNLNDWEEPLEHFREW